MFCSTVATPNYRMALYGTGGFAEILGHTMSTYRSIASLPGEAFATADTGGRTKPRASTC